MVAVEAVVAVARSRAGRELAVKETLVATATLTQTVEQLVEAAEAQLPLE